MVLREHDDPLNQSKGIMGPLENTTGVQNNRGRLKQRFDLIRKLGQGTYGKVQLGIDKETGQEVAIKTIKKSKIETEADLIRIRREIQIMSSVRHPNIIHIYEVFENREKMVLVMEYAAGGELYDYLNDRKVLKEDEARRIFRQIASAVYYCHKHKICHRDLKLENILLDESTNAKIADFGLSNVFDKSHLLKTFCGSPLYASPEIVRGTPYCGPEVDCWSLGVLLYTLVYGAMPFDGSNFKRLVKQISNGDYYEPKKTAEASQLIKFMLTVDSIKRATIKDVCSNSWINEGFDQACLVIAEELANATPVRLDILLSLSSPINSTNVVIEKHEDSTADKGECSKTTRDAKPKTKVKKGDGTQKYEDIHEEPATLLKLKTSNEAKGKQILKKKSKSSPLLELIVDVGEENERDVDDEGGDTLSEISEIQTIAEGESDSKEKIIKSKERIPKKDITNVESKVIETKPVKLISRISEAKGEATERAVLISKPDVQVDLDNKAEKVKADIQIDPENKTGKVKAMTNLPQVIKDVPKKKVTKINDTNAIIDEKLPDSAAIKLVDQPKEVKKVAAEKPAIVQLKKVEEKATAEQRERLTETTQTLKEKVIEVEAVSKTEENATSENVTNLNLNLEHTPDVSKEVKMEKEVSPPKVLQTQKAMKLKQRSDSTNSENTSPTRIERRNSKVISQKTAELIQNLETKTTTAQDAKGKKFVFPSLKVSDAKSRFETSSSDNTSGRLSQLKPAPADSKSVSATDREKKQNSAELKPKLKLKSTSPSPNDSTQVTKNGHIESSKNESNHLPEGKISPNVPQKEKSIIVLPKLPSGLDKNIENTTQDTPNLKVSIETNKDLPVMEIASGSKSPRRSRSPRKPETPKVEKEQPITEVPTIANSQHLLKDTETLKKPIVPKPKTQVSGVREQIIKPEPVIIPPVPSSVQNVPATTPIIQKPSEKIISSIIPTESASIDSNKEQVKDGKEKLLVKLPSQSKEQAAKKIGSVIQKIVSSESVDKGLENRRMSASTPTKVDSKPAFRTEIQQFVMSPDGSKKNVNKTQRTEVTFPVAAAASLQERIIPIKLIDEFSNGPTPPSTNNNSGTNMSRSSLQRMDSAKSSVGFSRQNSSETESSISTAAPKHEALKKSPREFIIPIKMESSGHTVTPKEDVLNSESSLVEDKFRLDSRLRSGRFGRPKRYNRLLSDSSVEDDSISASTSRRSSLTPSSHARSLSQGDEPQTPGTPGTYKSFRQRQSLTPLDRSDSCSSADEDEEDAFEVLTAESLFTSLLDRVRNLTKRLNRESSAGPSWVSGSESPAYGLWGSSSPLQEFIGRAPSETRQFISPTPGARSTTRSFSREPSVTVTITTRPGWRQSLSREMSGESDSVSEAKSISGSLNEGRSYSSFRNARDTTTDTASMRSLPLHLNSRRQIQSPFRYCSQFSEPAGATSSQSSSYTPSSISSNRPLYGRTASNTDYSSPHSTLPLRRPIRAYERSFTGRDFSSPLNAATTDTNSPSVNYSRSSNVASSRVDLSRVESPSNFPRYRSFSRVLTTPEPDRVRETRLNSAINGEREIHAQDGNDTIRTPLAGESNGWVGGSTSSSTKTTAAKLTTQEKMNNYQNYYYNLNKYPTRRLDVLNPAANPSLSSRPSTMYETSFIDNGNNSNDFNKSQFFGPRVRDSKSTSERLSRDTTNSPELLNNNLGHGHAQVLNDVIEDKKNYDTQMFPSSLLNSIPSHEFGVSLKPLKPNYVENVVPQQEKKAPSSLGTGLSIAPVVRKRPPELSIRQQRPVSISTFNEKPVGVNSDSTPQLQPINPISCGRSLIISPPEEFGNSAPFPRSISPKSDLNFVRAEATRLTSPSPVEDDGRAQIQSTTPKLKRDVRATSVEKITRFLERKSKPREMHEIVKPFPVISTDNEPVVTIAKNKDRCSLSPVKQSKSGQSKISKPKFIDKICKWGKFTNKVDDNVVQPNFTSDCTKTPEPSSENDNSDKSEVSPNESVLLQRAISPDKKPKVKFGATTVNYMLGKFRKMEENISNNTNMSKPTCGKPPIGISSGVVRRLQTPYAGARSDSVLTLQNRLTNENSHLANPRINSRAESPLPQVQDFENSKIECVKNNDVLEHSRSRPDKATQEPIIEKPTENKSTRRPVSLGIFSANSDMSKSTSLSFIPRFHRAKSGQEGIGPAALPDINLDIPQSGYANHGNADEHPLTPTSVSDSFDSGSVSSEKADMSLKSPAPDDCVWSPGVRNDPEPLESVSERIFRKSFYSRFNSLDRKKPPVSSPFVVSNRQNSTLRSATTCAANKSGSEQPGTSFLPIINKYNPNPLFKELITDEFKLNSRQDSEFSHRVTSKLSQLLNEIESDIKSCNNNREFIKTPKNYETKLRTEN